MKKRLITFVGAVLTAWVVGGSAFAISPVMTAYDRVGYGIVSYNTSTGNYSQMRTTSAMRMGGGSYTPSTGSFNSSRSYGRGSSAYAVGRTTRSGGYSLYNRGIHQGVYTVGATSPTADASSTPSYGAPASSRPRRVAPENPSYGDHYTEGGNTYWYDGEDWILLPSGGGGGESMGDVTQPIGDAVLPLLLMAFAFCAYLSLRRRRSFSR